MLEETAGGKALPADLPARERGAYPRRGTADEGDPINRFIMEYGDIVGSRIAPLLLARTARA